MQKDRLPTDDTTVQMADEVVFYEVGGSQEHMRHTGMVALAPRDFSALMPGERLLCVHVDILVYMAATMLRMRTGAEVRVVAAAVVSTWLGWSHLTPGTRIPETNRVASGDPPGSLEAFQLDGADFLFLPWCGFEHYSTVVVCNPGAYPLSNCSVYCVL